MTDWLPISSAPKDGTDFLCLRRVNLMGAKLRHEITIGWFKNGKLRLMGSAWHMKVTHWMPLPSTPTVSSSTGE